MNKKETVILSALLHDIGKFYQRAYPEKTILSSETLNLQNSICPYNKKGNFFIHQHVLWTNEFFTKYLKGYDEVANLAIYHHYPDKYEHKIICLSDWLSSGERREREEDETLPDKIRNEPLVSIFAKIEINNNIESHFCPVEIVGKEISNLYPCKNKEEALNEKRNFKILWDDFIKEISGIKPSDGFKKNYLRLQNLLKKYTLFVPSSAYFDKSEISLFHHLKSSAAIAGCLFDLQLSDQVLNDIIETFYIKQSQTLQRKDFVLISGDISGIQDFIYSVTTKHALKGLRGRSFYLQIVSETIAKYILDEFGLPECNLLFLGGGNFIILLPHTDTFNEKIQGIIKKIKESLFTLYKGKISFIAGHNPISYQDLTLQNFSKKIEELRSIMAREKRRKFSQILENKNLFEPYPEIIDKELHGCEICGEEIENMGRCSLCESFETLAKDISGTKQLIIKQIPKKEQQTTISSWKQFPNSLGYDYIFNKNITTDSNGISYLFNDSDFLDKSCDCWRFESVYSPQGTLEELSDKATGTKKWAALRMDVDNLGLIFSKGLSKTGISISRFSMLSSMISLFFSLGINDLREKKYNNCCIVYSGGDDLFILGPWSDIPVFAMDIREAFKNFTCQHPDINISGGIFVSPSSGFPVYKAAIEAGDAEEKAKTKEKNKICFLDTAVSWSDFSKIHKIAEEIYKLIKEKKVSRSLLSILYAGYQEEKLLKQKKIPYLRIWRIFYALKRFMERHKQEQQLEEIRKQFISNFKLQPNLNLAVRWAELLTRKEQGVKNE